MGSIRRWAAGLGKRSFPALVLEILPITAGCLGGWHISCCTQIAVAPLPETTGRLGLANPYFCPVATYHVPLHPYVLNLVRSWNKPVLWQDCNIGFDC